MYFSMFLFQSIFACLTFDKKAANVGIGVSGNEGRQAVLAADFAIPRFNALGKLLLVHGHWNYARLANMIKYFFFKNYVFVMNQFWFQLFCGFSGRKVLQKSVYLMNNPFDPSIFIHHLDTFFKNFEVY